MEDQVIQQSCSSRKRDRPSSDDSEKSEFDTSVQVKRLRKDLLELLDDTDLDPVSQDLDSVMRSFEEELSTPPPVTLIDLTSDSGNSSPPELGFLLEASDDDLGLPPSSSSTASTDETEVTEVVRPPYDSSELGGLWGFDSFDEQIPNYGDSFGLGPCEVVAYEDGLFQYEDGYFAGAGDFPDFSWRTE